MMWAVDSIHVPSSAFGVVRLVIMAKSALDIVDLVATSNPSFPVRGIALLIAVLITAGSVASKSPGPLLLAVVAAYYGVAWSRTSVKFLMDIESRELLVRKFVWGKLVHEDKIPLSTIVCFDREWPDDGTTTDCRFVARLADGQSIRLTDCYEEVDCSADLERCNDLLQSFGRA